MTSLVESVMSSLPSMPEAVAAFEIEMLKHKQEACPVYHHFSPGLYIREVNLPAGIVAMGHRQKTEHLNVFLKGRVSIVNDDGGISELKAPMLFTGKPGRKIGYIHEDVVWLNIYPTEETDVETLESMFLDKSKHWNSTHVQKITRIADVEDYKLALKESGFTEEYVRGLAENPDDQIDFPAGTYKVAVYDSSIEGKGLFATADIKAGEEIAVAKIKGLRTPAGRYTNHSASPNAKMVFEGEDLYLIATKDIPGCHGGEHGDEITRDYRELLNRGE